MLHSTNHGMQILATCSTPPTNTRQKLNTHMLMDFKTRVFGATRLLSAGRFLVYAAFLPNLPPRHSESTPECTPNVSQSTPSSNPQGQTICSIREGLFFPIPAIFFSFPVVTREATLVHPHKGVAVAREAPRSQKTTKGSDCSERAGLIIETTESWICNVQRCQGLAPCVGLSLRSLPMAPLPPTRCASIFWFRDSSTPLSSARHTARAPRWLRSAAQSSTQCPRTL